MCISLTVTNSGLFTVVGSELSVKGDVMKPKIGRTVEIVDAWNNEEYEDGDIGIICEDSWYWNVQVYFPRLDDCFPVLETEMRVIG
jgi:hypothetical protein